MFKEAGGICKGTEVKGETEFQGKRGDIFRGTEFQGFKGSGGQRDTGTQGDGKQ